MGIPYFVGLLKADFMTPPRGSYLSADSTAIMCLSESGWRRRMNSNARQAPGWGWRNPIPPSHAR